MRLWKNRGNEDTSVHCLGNGRLAVYALGPQIVKVFGPPYSSTSFLACSLQSEAAVEVRSQREAGTAIWTHDVLEDGAAAGSMTDFVDGELPVFARALNLARPLAFDLRVEDGVETLENGERFRHLGAQGGLLARSQRGVKVWMNHPSPVRFDHQVVVRGKASLTRLPAARTWRVECAPGVSEILLVGGASYPECIQNTEAVLGVESARLLERTRGAWRAFSERRLDFQSLLPASTPRREDLLRAIDSVAVVIKTQQGIEGGILAGQHYPWAAFRDQFGAMRCLLALGHYDEAKAILRYYWDIYRRRGALHNGQDIGLEGFFHVHENDDVELTGYLITQAFDYREKTGDDAFLREILPMLEWAFDAQRRHLLGGMLGFNGDETYIAGGMMPRGVINDGSAEATLLFLRAGRRFLDWTEGQSVWPPERLREARRAVEDTRSRYRESFWRDGAILTNNPERMSVAQMPRFRHGVCESGGRFVENAGLKCQGGAIDWVEKTPDGHYLCPACFARGLRLGPERPLYQLASVSLVPLYLGSDLFSHPEIASMARPIIDRFQATGRLRTTEGGATTVGYDYGLLLFTLSELGHPLAGKVYDRMLDVLDSTGSWVEYYRDDQPVGCPYRPYESGINLEAALRFAFRSAARPNR